MVFYIIKKEWLLDRIGFILNAYQSIYLALLSHEILRVIVWESKFYIYGLWIEETFEKAFVIMTKSRGCI